MRGLKKTMKNSEYVGIAKLIMLTFLTCCVTITFVGCENGNLNIDSNKLSLSNSENDYLVGEQGIKEESVLLKELENNTSVLDTQKMDGIEDVKDKEEVYKYNESGKIIIVMYHKFAEEEKDEWTRSYDNFYNDLKYLYEHGYRTISLSDYIKNEIKVPVGCTPIVLTFDDGTKGQFNLIEDESGNLIANPKSAVGVMERFYKEYPEFGLNGTFYINKTGFFGANGTRKEKLEYLIQRGFEIGNHTSNHINFSKATSSEEVIKEVGALSKEVYELTGYKINSLALPFGSMSKIYEEEILKGVYEDSEYENKALLLVGANPALSPSHDDLNLSKLPRVRARGGNKEVECDLYWWLEKMDKNPKLKYERIHEN